MDEFYRHSAQDIGLIIFGGILLVTLNIVISFKKSKQITSFRQGARLLLFGVILLVTAIVGNGFLLGRWDLKTVIAFLSFIKLSPVIIFQGLAYFGYLSLSFGLTMVVIFLLKRSKQKG